MFGTAEPKLNPLDPELRAWADSIMRDVSPAKLRADVERFPAPRNRLHSSDAMAQADKIIMQSFRDAGWVAEHRPYELKYILGYLDYEQDEFPAGRKPALYPRLAGANILGIKHGLNCTDAIIIGAHHDTIRDSPGADDNTASIAALLELARVLAPFKFRNTVILAAFDMEEINFVGSSVLVEELSMERKILGAIVYETMSYTAAAPNSQFMPRGIGRLYPAQARKIRRRQYTGDWTIVIYREFAISIARSFAESLAHIAGPDAAILMRDATDTPVLGKLLKRLIPSIADFSRSDHICFWEASIPAIMIGDTAEFRNPNYHKPTDTPDTLDYDRLAAIVGATAVAIARIAGLER